jgi:hypothetical protein
MVGIAAGWITWVWRHKRSPASEVVSGDELGRLAELLAAAVYEEWTRAAGERGLLEPEPIPVCWQRPAVPVAGPVVAAVASTRFAPLPGLTAAGERRLQAGQVSELHELYGGLGSGRLVIAGGPGAGKSGAAVLLILAALRYRRALPEESRSQVPVPVMFSLDGWDPAIRRSGDWLAERLWQAYPLFAGRQGATAARSMLDEGRIAVILDGLDEIPGDLRPAVLQALSQQATFRLVLLTRTAEMAKAAARALLQGAAAIELQDITPAAAADYLTRTQLDPPPQGWRELTGRLRQEPGSPLAQALNTPLMLTLVRDTYRATDDVGELLSLRGAAGQPASRENITDHLLDRVLPAAYARQPGEPSPRYDLATAERALRRIATRMNQDGTRDLRWWHIPAWAPAAPRRIATCLGAAIVAGLTFGLVVGLWVAPAFGVGAAGLANVIGFGILAGLSAGLVAGLAFGRGNKIPKRAAPLRWRQLFRRRSLVAGILAGIVVAGLVGGYWAWHSEGPASAVLLAAGIVPGLGAWLVAWIGAGIVAGMSQPGTDNASPLSPLSSWRSDQAFGRRVGLVVWLGLALAFGFVFGFAGNVRTELGFGVAFGTAWRWGLAEFADWLLVGLLAWLAAGIAAGIAYPQAWSSFLAFAQLAASDRTPVGLMRFLEDARRRGVLRTVGPVYQFRHARLQDRLAAQESVTGAATWAEATGRMRRPG